MDGEQSAEKFSLELTGPGAEPATVDSAKLLSFAAAYFELICRMGSEDDVPLELHGLEIVNKCVAVRVTPSDLDGARRLADASTHYLSGGEQPTGLKALVDRVRSAFSDFGPDYKAKVIIGPWERSLIAPEPTISMFPVATESMRVTVLRVGGASPRVRIRSALDGDAFSIDITVDQAQELATHLYREVDIFVRLVRTGEGRVAYCQLLEFTPLEDRDASQALDEWFRPHASFWANVGDVSDVLGRRDRS